MGEKPRPPLAGGPPMAQKPSGLLVPDAIVREKQVETAQAVVDVCPLLSGGPYVLGVSSPDGQMMPDVRVNVVPCIRDKCHWWHPGDPTDPDAEPAGCMVKTTMRVGTSLLAGLLDLVEQLVDAAENTGALAPSSDGFNDPEGPIVDAPKGKGTKAPSAVPLDTAKTDAAAARAALDAASGASRA